MKKKHQKVLFERLRLLSRRCLYRRRPSGPVTRHIVPVYLPERFLAELRPNMSAVVDDIISSLPRDRWAKGRVNWKSFSHVFGKPRRTSLTLSYPLSSEDVSRAIAGYLQSLLEEVEKGSAYTR